MLYGGDNRNQQARLVTHNLGYYLRVDPGKSILKNEQLKVMKILVQNCFCLPYSVIIYACSEYKTLTVIS